MYVACPSVCVCVILPDNEAVCVSRARARACVRVCVCVLAIVYDHMFVYRPICSFCSLFHVFTVLCFVY